MKNFDYLQNINGLQTLYQLCNAAEETQQTDADICALNCRKALERVVQIVYRLKKEPMGVRENLLSLTTRPPYTTLIADGDKLDMATAFVRKTGNIAAHSGGVTRREAYFSLLNIYNVVGNLLLRLDLIPELPPFDKDLIPKKPSPHLEPNDTEEAATAEFYEQVSEEVLDKPKPAAVTEEMSEAETREQFINLLLREAGWEVMEKKNTPEAEKAGIEIQVHGLDTPSGTGYCDYVLYDKDGTPLAVVEAKRTSVNEEKGREQGVAYAECLFQQYGVYPVVYYTNGFNIKMLDGYYNEPRRLMGFHSLEDLKRIHHQREREKTDDLNINEDISGRPYQKMAIRAVWDHLKDMNRRALLVMATGTGKTRTAASLCDVLLRKGWISNVLFLADRTTLVEQACTAFRKFMPQYTTCILTGSKEDERKADLMFSTYNAMMGYIDSDDKEFGVGRFDLIILDEAHRSVYNKYKAIFSYFDSFLIGLTATPREDVDSNTYELFGLDNEPNYDYDLDLAVKEGYLVDYVPKSRTTRRLREGIRLDSLTEEEREQLDDVWTFEQAKKTELTGKPQEKTPRDIESHELFNYIYNKKTIDLMLQDLMDNGLKICSGTKIGKTIIFAYDHDHAKLIEERFYHLYPTYDKDFCKLIDYTVSDYRTPILNFIMRDNLPQIAVSVAMLDTGVDAPDVLNLVLFKPVYSTIKYIQMLGRGTRLSEAIFDDGTDKQEFYVFDWCENFEYFNTKPKGSKTISTISVTQRLFELKTDVAFALQHKEYQEDEFCVSLGKRLKEQLHAQVAALNEHHISVREHWPLVLKFKPEEQWGCLTSFDVIELKDQIAPLVREENDDSKTQMFDALMFNIELSLLMPDEIKATQSKNTVMKIARRLEGKASLPAVKAKMETISAVAKVEFWKDASLPMLEKVREDLRGLLDNLKTKGKHFPIHIDDTIEIKDDVKKPKLQTSYKVRILDYLREHSEHQVLQKIYNLEKINADDIKELERICWQELGTKEEYDKYVSKGEMICGDKVAIFIRSMIGVDVVKARELFSQFLSDVTLNSLQEQYVSDIINYVRENGDIEPLDLFRSEALKTKQWNKVFPNELPQLGNFMRELHARIAV